MPTGVVGVGRRRREAIPSPSPRVSAASLPGWGVGLGVCKKYLAMQLGSISLVKSDDNETEFLIKIPLSSCGIV